MRLRLTISVLTAPRTIRPAIILCALPVAGCGLSDHFTTLPVPTFLRYQPWVEVRDHPYPDVRALAKSDGRKIFAHRPDEIEISTPLYESAIQKYSICARVADASRHPMIVVTISRFGLAERRRAEPGDGCEGQEFERVAVD
jgi:hypothetical protein